jgi:hypothetical protein
MTNMGAHRSATLQQGDPGVLESDVATRLHVRHPAYRIRALRANPDGGGRRRRELMEQCRR